MNPLSPLAWLYRAATDVRNSLYNRGIFKTYQLGAQTISVGNLTTGGTGKTPLVALVARLLAEHDERVCILTRGYGRREPSRRVLVSDASMVLADAQTGGDEPVELAYKLLGKAAIVADRDRFAGAEWAVERLDPTVFVLDDAFQHRRAGRDLDLVCIDATNPFGNGRLLPAGTLREGRNGLKRADAIVITRTDLVKDISAIEKEIRRYAPDTPIFQSSNKIASIRKLDSFVGGTHSENTLDRHEFSNAFAFCGLGNPSNFFRQLENEGIGLVGRKTYPDHYFYSQEDVAEIEKKARAASADRLITTVKDAVRLLERDISMPCYIAEIETVMADPDRFRELILS